MTRKEAAQRLNAFERDHGRELVGLASHAALPVVLNAEALHLLRINYFLDPPHMLPYTAEASLLLSSLCTEIDDGLYVIAPELRDLLLKNLIEDEDYGGARLRDVARLLWEYSERRTPWGDRPGLTEAQQLTALNFIDPARALNWLARARRGEGALPVDDNRWFVVLEQDLKARATAVEQAEGEAVFLGGKLPALTELRDALMKDHSDVHAPLGVAYKLDLPLPGLSEQMGASRLWQAVLDAAWISNRMPELLQAVDGLGTSEGWTKAVNEYWFRLSPALRVEKGRFQEPPPEWQILEQQRALIEQALRALVLIVADEPSGEARIIGMGTLVGDYVVLTHKSMAPGIEGYQQYVPGSRYFVELAVDHPTLAPQPGVRRLEVTVAGVQEHTGLTVLTTLPDSDRTGFAAPLWVMPDSPPVLKGRKVCVMGYPGMDARNDPGVLSRVLGDTYGVLRLQPGEILDEDIAKGILIHNCFTAGGNGGSPLLDVQTGQVLGLHFGAMFNPGPAGFKTGSAISMFRLLGDPLLVEAGVFRPPSQARSPVAENILSEVRPDRLFVDRMQEQELFLKMLEDRGGQVLAVEGEPGIGKSALLRRLAQLARQRGRLTAFIDASTLTSEASPDEVLDDLWRQLGVGSPEYGRSNARQEVPLQRRVGETLRSRPAAIFVDNVREGSQFLVTRIVEVLRSVESCKIVIAARRLPPYLPESFLIRTQVLHLGPLDPHALREWLAVEHLDLKEEVLKVLERMVLDHPNRIATLIDAIRDILPGLSEPRRPAVVDNWERLPTVEVAPPKTAIVFHDDVGERHGDWVVTRGYHALSVPERYRIAVFPVTNGLFSEFVRDGGYRHDEFWRSAHPAARAGFICQDRSPGPATWASAATAAELPNHPVAGISYHEAIALVAWLERTVAPFDRLQWCLPTEDMWEFAARGPTGFLYPWGTTYQEGRCNSREANIGGTSPIGRFPAGRSPCGAEDMGGNVWEFVRASDQQSWACVLRGGSFANSRDEIKSSLRLFGVPRDHRPPDFGLRCALEWRGSER